MKFTIAFSLPLIVCLAFVVGFPRYSLAQQLSASETIQFDRGFSGFPNYDHQFFADSGTVGQPISRVADVYADPPGPNPIITGTGEVNASATYGLLGASAYGRYFGLGALGNVPSVEATSTARFFDRLTIPGSGQGSIVYAFQLSGFMYVDVAGEYGPPSLPTAATSLSVTMGGGSEAVGGNSGVDFAVNASGPTLIAPNHQPFVTQPLLFNFGESFDLSVTLTAQVSLDHISQWTSVDFEPFGGNTQYNTIGSANFLDTAQLTGIQVFDAVGNPISDFTIQADSGTQYPLGVPEPCTGSLAGIGALAGAVWVFAARRRATRRRVDRLRVATAAWGEGLTTTNSRS